MIEVNRAGPADARILAEIAAGALAGPWSQTQFAEELALPMARVVVVRDAGEPLGYATARVVGDELELLGIAVRADRRRAGLGRRLLAGLGALSPGARVCHLEVRRGNREARAFYRALAFHEVGARARYYPDGEDAVLMTASLGG